MPVLQNREHVRSRSFLGAKIVLEGGYSVFDCIVRDISPAGARLKVQNAVSIPDTFKLLLSDGRSFDATVKWRRIDSVGVSFPVPDTD
ncbi:PilZ domain-containing protein [Rhizobium sp. B230/85]|nr:PilZ domain-containing protein [Rhizobium sp. L58/93]MBO9135822.1 PilZ domain-containing protein [Rhizobium sp. B209b/85]MBO9169963.1 PilZ domain-containing protein [Rhizobium sp. L245/93]MBO9185915.1 PilZ domain-containing protein [Rhizobium sp. E27B/91]QXZ82851.1 PilZ domain-containing protein [Rhizobium sp. K1/93]QXZ89636.1 PilZ domain-containing protein [Rhizobium sp. K15/93]QXZ97928.1 PilZ domain-containing protein [Rhizobium sp. B230/85]QYA02224.1 PilZ domain-containing protein [Rhi